MNVILINLIIVFSYATLEQNEVQREKKKPFVVLFW